MGDLISRQEALEAIQDAHHHVEVMSMIDHGRLSGLGQASNIVRDLPSVCTDCIKHGGDWECDRTHCRKETKQQATKASDCISYAEEYTIEEFMQGQDLGNPEDGSLR